MKTKTAIEAELTAVQILNDLLTEKLCHIGSILEYRYGIANTPAWRTEYDEYCIFIETECEEIECLKLYSAEDLLHSGADAEASELRRMYVMEYDYE